ncbi:MAG: GNAT family N-acetyltransferase [Bacilli bacterium]|nr:GNAT family N-acetyltransferase [Bacilli bacterium]
MLDRKEYVIDENIILKPVPNNDDIVYKYIIKMHEHHNNIDNICPVQDVKRFNKMDNSVFWLIYYNNEIVGFLNMVYREQCIDNTIEIHMFYVDDIYRKYGIGSKIIQALKLVVKEKGYKGIVAKVYCDNPAINFYERNGFKTYYRYMISEIE